MRRALVMLALFTAAGCAQPPAAPVLLEVRVPQYASSESFAAQMFHEYAGLRSRLHFQFVPTTGMTTPALFAQGAADLTATSADAAYFAFRDWGKGNERNQLRAIAALQLVPVHLLVRPDARIATVTDLHRIGFMTTVPVSDRMNERVARELGIPATVPIPSAQIRDLGALFVKLNLDAMLLPGDYPSAGVQRWLKDGARLVDIRPDAIARLQQAYPFIHPMAIPAGTYAGQHDAIHTFGTNMVLVCRRGVSDDVVYEVTRHLFEVLSRLRQQYPELRRLELKQALATPIPLHPGAATFYREMELGS